ITGDPAVDRAQNRIKRMFDDRTSLRCARVGLDGAEALGPRIGRRALEHAHFSLLRPPGPRPYLVQSYARDTGDVFNDLSVAIYAGGRHYGALSVAYPAQTS
ncbi:MAG: methyl-accepting chemotaxis protein, partial [Candidatus Eremiobacteraeota bacterium]|nr:methyl-accepting chemotaxis protein [Candidatus Eremiobacteraeota bacterium]